MSGQIQFEWYREDEKKPISLDNSMSYRLTQKDVGFKIYARYKYLDRTGLQNVVDSTTTNIIENLNNEPQGPVFIVGETKQHQTLTVTKDQLFDLDGFNTESLSYQWMADEINIIGAHSHQFKLTQAQVNKTISVKISYTDDFGMKEEMLISRTKVVDDVNDIPIVSNFTVSSKIDQKKLIELQEYVSELDPQDKDKLTFTVRRFPKNGKLFVEDTEISSNLTSYPISKTLTYSRNSADSANFEYIINDSQSSSEPATVNLIYENSPPTVKNLSIIAIRETQTAPIALEAKDDVSTSFIFEIVELPKHGSLLNSNEKVTINQTIKSYYSLTYKSDLNEAITDSFKFKAFDDAHLGSKTAEVTINIKPVDKPPTITHSDGQGAELFFTPSVENVVTYEFTFKDDFTKNLDTSIPMVLFSDSESSTPVTNNPLGKWLEWTIGEKGKLSVSPYKIDDPFKSIRVVLAAADDTLSSSKTAQKHKVGFIIKPTVALDNKNNFKKQNNTTWVDVCWQISNEALTEIDNEGIWKRFKGKIKNYVNETWVKHSSLKFDWREDNWNRVSTNKDFKWSKLNNCEESYDAIGYKQIKINLNIKSDTENNKTNEDNNANTVYITVGDKAIETDSFTIIHNFGLALGFPEENQRFDIFKNTSDQCDDVNNTKQPFVPTNDVISANAIKQITYKQWQQRPYNRFSIMNICSKDKYFSGDNLELSNADIARVQEFFGKPASKKAHLIKDDQFFTGLYDNDINDINDENSKNDKYYLYQDGVIDTEYDPVSKNIIKNIDIGDYFALISRDKKESVLFKNLEANANNENFVSLTDDNVVACDNQIENFNTANIVSNVCTSIQDYGKFMTPLVDSIYYSVSGPDKQLDMMYCDSNKTTEAADEQPAPQNLKYCLNKEYSEFFYKATDTNKVLYFKGRKYKPLDI